MQPTTSSAVLVALLGLPLASVGRGAEPAADGTKDVREHGDPAMPVWGETFRAESAWDMGRRVEVQGKLMLITDYVRSIQAK
jgi:hypothetical protein